MRSKTSPDLGCIPRLLKTVAWVNNPERRSYLNQLCEWDEFTSLQNILFELHAVVMGEILVVHISKGTLHLASERLLPKRLIA